MNDESARLGGSPGGGATTAPPPFLRSSIGPPSRPRWTRCGSGRRRTPGKATRSRRPGGGCRWSRWMPPPADRTRTDRSPCSTRSKGAGSSSPTTSCGTPATPRPSSARAAPGSPAGRANCPTCIPATSRTRCSARARTTKASATATSWAGTCRGTRPQASLDTLLAGARSACCTSSATSATATGSSRPVDHRPRRRGHGQQLRAHGPHRLRTPGGVGGLARRLASRSGGGDSQRSDQRTPHRPVVANRSRPLRRPGRALAVERKIPRLRRGAALTADRSRALIA